MDRRTFLAASGIGLATSLGGCLGGSSGTPGTGTEDGTTTGNETTTEDGTSTDRGAGATELVDHEIVQFTATGTPPSGLGQSRDFAGDVVVIDSEERADAVLFSDDLPSERREAVADFLQATDFDESVLLYVESVGPNACHDEIEVADLAVEDGELTGTVSVVGPSEDGDGMTACADVVTYPSALVRATFSGEPATRVRFRFLDGWDNETVVTASAADPLSADAAGLDGYVRPEGEPARVPEGLACDDEGVQRVENWASGDEIPWGETGALSGDGDDTSVFALRVDQREVALGETVEITMTNLTDEAQYTGNRYKYSFELLTADGWQDVRVRPEDRPLEYTDEAFSHDPGDGFLWTLELTEDGLVDGHYHEDLLEVCPDLQPGRYRFVFWEPAVAVAFDVTE